MRALEKYLARWAEPDAGIAAAIDGPYERCLVVPACREDVSALEGYVGAAKAAPGRTLAIIVVNGMENAAPGIHSQNARFIEGVVERLSGVRRLAGPPRTSLGVLTGALDVLLVDRASEGGRLPPKSGVGLARKIGADIAVSLYVAERVRSPLVYFTDADASLSEGHFTRPELVDVTSELAAAVFPFWHDPGPDEAVNRATALHELSLRYYVRGLAHAGSPYAFHTLGSAMAVHARAYAAVRGVPKREAGEDFYLLGKAAKVGEVRRTTAPLVRLRSRASDRTPFGTGAGVARGLVAPDGALTFYAPECFVALRHWLAALEAFSEHGSVERLVASEGGLSNPEWEAVRDSVLDPRGTLGLRSAASQARSAADRRFRVHEWFDAFRTLKFVHALRASVWPSTSWESVRAGAEFLQGAADSDLDGMRRALLEQEAAARLGPFAAIPAAGNGSP